MKVSRQIFIPRRKERDRIKNVYWSSLSTRHSCHILMKPEFSGQIFEKY